MKHTAETRKLLRSLDAELEVKSRELGVPVLWTERERAILGLIASNSDRKCDLSDRYEEAEDTKTRLKLSAELRLLEAALARLLKQLDTEPVQKSPRSVKAQRAANVRWARHA